MMVKEVKKILNESYRLKISEEANKLLYSQETSQAIKKMMKEAGKTFFEGMIQNAMSQVMQEFQSKLYNARY